MKNLIEFVKIRAKLSGRQLLSFDELAEFPADQLEELESEGVLFQIEDADGIICTECDKECWEPVEPRQKDGRDIGVIYCEDKDCGGLVPVELERLQQWAIVKEKLFKLKKPAETERGGKEDKSNTVEVDFTIWNKDKNYKLMLKIINDSERKGIKVESDVDRKCNTLKERLQKAFANYGHESYKLFAESLDKKKGNRIYTKLSVGMVSAKIEK